ncbi:MAG: ABC transporter permease [Chloroflexi bacterium]|nr:ABC transporter permease [Chloroflexota bacterium]
METVLTSGTEEGLIYGFMALGILLSFRMLGFPDLTVEGCFPFAAGVAATLLVAGASPPVATIVAVLSGIVAGLIAGAIHTRLGINNILAGILVASALYTAQLRTMGRPNVPLLNYDTIYGQALGFLGLTESRWGNIAFLAMLTLIVGGALFWFLHTDLGLAVRATGDNEIMVRSLGVDVRDTKMITLALGNGLVALSGALAAQEQGFADVSMGIGTLVAAAAAVVIGETVLGQGGVGRSLLSAVLGSIAYRALLAFGLRLGFPATDFKAVAAVLVLLALVAPQLRNRWRETVTRRAVARGGAAT